MTQRILKFGWSGDLPGSTDFVVPLGETAAPELVVSLHGSPFEVDKDLSWDSIVKRDLRDRVVLIV